MCFHMGLGMPGVKLIIAAGWRIETELRKEISAMVCNSSL